MDFIVYAIIGIVILSLISFLLKLSFKIFFKLILDAIGGVITIYIINFFGAALGISIELNLISSLIVGIFGIFGVIFLLIF